MQITNYSYAGISPASLASRLRSSQSDGTQGMREGVRGGGDADSYVHDGGMDFSSSGVYGAPNGIKAGGPAGTSGASGSGDSLMSDMSEAFRANEDSIRAVMEDLGLSEEDLADAENMALLANAMNEGAAKLGVPQIEDVDAAVEELMNAQATGGSSEKADAGVPGVAGGAGGAAAGAENSETSSDSSDSEDETTSKVVMVNGTPYLETTTVKDGVTTKTLTALGGGGMIRRESIQTAATVSPSMSRPIHMGSYGTYNFNFNVM